MLQFIFSRLVKEPIHDLVLARVVSSLFPECGEVAVLLLFLGKGLSPQWHLW